MAILEIYDSSSPSFRRKYEIIAKTSSSTTVCNAACSGQVCKILYADQSLSIKVINETSTWFPFLVLNQNLKAECEGKLLFNIEFRKWFKKYIVFPDNDEELIRYNAESDIIIDKIRFVFSMHILSKSGAHAQVEVDDAHISTGLCLGIILWKMYYSDDA